VPLEAPQLDSRSFEDLVREARLRIPTYTPEWTDFNDSDPGMTLVQLFAWLTEMMLYEMNRVPDRTYVNFLALLGQELDPPAPAKAYLTFSVQEGAREVDPVPERTQVVGFPPGGDPLIFETITGLDLIRPKLVHTRVSSGANVVAADRPFAPFGWAPQIGAAFYLGFAFPAESTPPRGAPFPQQMRMRVVLKDRGEGPDTVSCRELRQPPPPQQTLVWEYNASAKSPLWLRLETIEDTSVAFTRDGDLFIEGPPENIPLTFAAGIAEPQYWLRCRLASGGYQAGPPEIDLLLNTVAAENLSTIKDELVAVGMGLPDQTVRLAQAPVDPETLELTVTNASGAAERWERKPDFLDSERDDRHYLLTPATGEIRFGDGTRGAIPPPGSDIVAVLYRFGGGRTGNLPCDTITTLLSNVGGVDRVTNERPAVGGRDEQSLADAKREAPGVLRSRNRAVTAEDFAALARKAGGVARATALASAHPDFPGVAVPGAVQVVIVPDSPFLTRDRSPLPSADLLRHVCEFLEDYRLITTELTVTKPTYTAIEVEATIQVPPTVSTGELKDRVSEAIDEYLDPLGRRVDPQEARTEPGWMFGRDLYPSGVIGAILRVKDVLAVVDFQLLVDQMPWESNDPIFVPPCGLVFSTGDHRIRTEIVADR
jgi:hypothetical protein